MVDAMQETRMSGATCPGRSGRRRRLRIAGAAAVVLASAAIASTVPGPPVGAAVSTVGGTCGFHVGAPLVSGAAGTLGFEFPVYPADPHQVCSVSVTGTASMDPTSGPAFTNVTGNHGSSSFTLHFTGGPLPLGVLWTWSPHCADPAAATVLTLTIAGQSASSAPQPAQSCSPDFGGSSRLGFDLVDPGFTLFGVGLAATTDDLGYWGVTASGDVRAVGSATTPGVIPIPNTPVVGVATDPNGGVWEVASDGGVFALAGAPFFGSLGGIPLNAPVVGMASTPDGGGYWLVAGDGGVFAFGDAAYYGSMGGMPLNAPVVGMAAPDAGGYWLVASDGGIFSFGDAAFHGSMGGTHLNAPVMTMAAPDAGGYWLTAYDGGVFALGDAPFEGSAGALNLSAPIFAMAGTSTGMGYWLLGGDGGVFAYGDALFVGPVPIP
jgi:hypothetical protein